MTPREAEAEAEGEGEGEAVAEIVGLDAPETTMAWVPAVDPFAQTTMTVNVPGLTFDQAADWPLLVPDNATWRPWEKFV